MTGIVRKDKREKGLCHIIMDCEKKFVADKSVSYYYNHKIIIAKTTSRTF